MAPYDNDSSGAEDDDFTETNVLLGYASADANGEQTSRLGGHPVCLTPSCFSFVALRGLQHATFADVETQDWLDASKPPSAALARCKVCKDLMVLLLQLNAELPDRFPGHERRLYVFSCRRKSCRRKEGSIRAVRGVRASAEISPSTDSKESRPKETPAPPKPASQGLGEALFGVKPPSAGSRPNPFALSSSSSTNPFAPKSTPAANPFSTTPAAPAPALAAAPSPTVDQAASSTFPTTFASALTFNAPPTTAAPAPPTPEPWPAATSLPPPYPTRWLADADYETLDPLPAIPQAVDTTSMEIDDNSTGGSGGGKEDKEVFESAMDSTFQKFADRVGQNPEQCIRYEFAGVPLLYAKGDAVGKMLHVGESNSSKVSGGKGMPRCGNCGAGRVFEVQLTPQAIVELECEEEGMEGMDWGTVIVGVCERDCQERGVGVGEAGYLEEWAGVQWEELTMKR